MNGPVPAIVVTLPASSADVARREIDDAATAGADLAEIRFDLWGPREFEEIDRLFPARLPLVGTLRSTAEGGKGPDAATERAERLKAIARRPFRWIDLETERDGDLAAELPDPSTLGRILSVHYPAGVSPEEWGRRLRDAVPVGCIRKVVARSGIVPLFQELLPRLPQPGPEAAVALTTGPSGPLLRAWARRLGAPMVFASLPFRPIGRPAPVEPSQVPVDHLRPYLEADGNAPLFGLAGHPVAHSWSPYIHARWMGAARRSGLYVPLDFETEGEFVAGLELLAEAGFRGINVTRPWKEAALESATEVSEGAEVCGVANTLTFRGDAIEAENTDLAAILRRLEELRGAGRWDGSALAVLGAGGAARATLAAATDLGVPATVYARREEAAEELAAQFRARVGRPEPTEAATLVVNATTAGRSGSGPLELPYGTLVGPGSHVLDWVYAPDSSELVDAATRAGATYEDGRRLLVYQAASSFGLWWGEEPSPAAIASVLTEVGCGA